MSSDDDPLLAIANDVVERRAVDWQERLAANPEHGQVLQNLRRIDELAAGFDRGEEEAPSVESGDRQKAQTTFTWGHLQVKERIGEGSFGEVYRAFDPILQRDVALKLKRDEAPAPSIATAFIEEARRLARVRHSNVLAVHGADVHEGRVGLWSDFLVGSTLEQEIETHGPFPAPRAVDLALALADALVAVHQAGLVHGDVKASNVMLEQDGNVVLMDFGAGADLGSDPDGHSPAGSPLSMAPELFADGRATQASDIYSLGVLLYRMLAGCYPVTAKTFDELAAHHRQSTRAPLGPERVAFPRSLKRLLGRLLAPNAAQRPSAIDTAERLRWIQEAPRRRRRRAAVTAVVLSLAVGTVTATVGYIQAHRSEGRAVAARQEAEAVTDFLRDILASPRPSESGHQTTVTELLERAVEKIDVQLADQPLVRARTLAVVGRTFLSLHRYSAAEPLLRRSLALRESQYDADDAVVLNTRLMLAECLIETKRRQEGEDLVDDIMGRANPLGADHSIQVRGRILLARAARNRQDFPSARKWLTEALDLRTGEAWVDDPTRRSAELDLGQILLYAGDYAAAETLLRQVTEWSVRTNGERHSVTLGSRHRLAEVLDRQGHSAEAELLMRRNLEVAESWLGAEDSYTIIAISDLSNNLADQGKIEQSVVLSERALKLSEQSLGPTDPNTLIAMGNHANRLRELGRVEEAAALMRETIRRVDEEIGPAHEAALINRYNLAELLLLEGSPEDALEIAREARTTMVATLGERHLFTLVTDALIGASLTAVGRYEEGQEILQRALELQRETMGNDHPNTLETQIYLARTLRARGHREEAASLLRDALERRQEALGAEHPKTMEVEAELQRWQQAEDRS